MNRKLIVVESTTSAQKIKASLSRLPSLNFSVFATKGRLLDLPSKKIEASDPSGFFSFYTPLKPKLYHSLVFNIETSDHVFIATDDDIEGEKIASDIAKIAKEKGVPYYRTPIINYSEESIKKALSQHRELNRDMIDSQNAKRFFDHKFSFNSNYPVGRVISPALNLIKDGELYHSTIVLNKENASISLSLKGISEKQFLMIQSELESLSLDDIELEEIKTTEHPFEHTILDGNEAITHLSNIFSTSPKEAFSILDELHKEGSISYFRTDSKLISDDQFDSIQTLSYPLSFTMLDRAKAKEKTEKDDAKLNDIKIRQSSHTGITPIGSENHYAHKIKNSLTKREQLKADFFQFIVNHSAIALSSNPPSLSTTSFKLANNNRLVDVLNRFYNHIDMSIKKEVATFNGNQYPFNSSLQFSLADNREDIFSKPLYLKKQPKALSCAFLLLNHNIGRTSTFAYHAHTIASLCSNKGAKLSLYGEKTLNHTFELYPQATMPDFYFNTEKKLFENKGIDNKFNSLLELIKKQSLDLTKAVTHQTPYFLINKEETPILSDSKSINTQEQTDYIMDDDQNIEIDNDLTPNL